jgi:hypothetical protein
LRLLKLKLQLQFRHWRLVTKNNPEEIFSTSAVINESTYRNVPSIIVIGVVLQMPMQKKTQQQHALSWLSSLVPMVPTPRGA